ncbi:hypothetical protein P8452_37361 [Trifolium repens]|nr:hypothetical protein P8452_37361 [Trifolium repens]
MPPHIVLNPHLQSSYFIFRYTTIFVDQGQKFQANAEDSDVVKRELESESISKRLLRSNAEKHWTILGVLHLLCVSVPIMCAAGFILVPAPPSWRNFHIFLYPSLMLCYYLVDFLNSHHRKCLAQHHLINLKKAVIATQCAWRGKVAWRELRNLIW